jgi:hypothetical protein
MEVATATVHDAFVSVRLTESGEIEAHTWQGLLVKVDLETGKTTKKEFVKLSECAPDSASYSLTRVLRAFVTRKARLEPSWSITPGLIASVAKSSALPERCFFTGGSRLFWHRVDN